MPRRGEVHTELPRTSRLKLLPPTQHNPMLGPQQKSFRCLISWERMQQRDSQKLLRVDFGGQEGGPKWAILGHKIKSLVYWFLFLSLDGNSVPRIAPPPNQGNLKPPRQKMTKLIRSGMLKKMVFFLTGSQEGPCRGVSLVAAYRAILRHYRRDTPIWRDTFSGRVAALPRMVSYSPPWHLVSQRHLCLYPILQGYRAILVR